MLEHGGKLAEASQHYGIPIADWLDLSTGINPHAWPVPPLPPETMRRLPQQDNLLKTACQYYCGQHALALSGSQAAIQALPALRGTIGTVGIISPGYAEHAHAWQKQGHRILPLAADEIEQHIDELNTLVLINPNNPTGNLFPAKRILGWHQRLQQRGGWLIVDEAFMDTSPEFSVVSEANRVGLVVLRSFGKFFGLPGLRVGFAFARPEILSQLEAQLGPWHINGPARWIASQALIDTDWQQDNLQWLQESGQRLQQLLSQFDMTPDGGTALFQWLRTELAQQYYQQLAKQGILTRLFTEPSSLRFGLPGNDAEWARLESALSTLLSSSKSKSAQQP